MSNGSENNNTPIIVKKGKKHHEGGHGGAWKVAYADFVTAMMALFIVLWILGQDDEVKAGVANYFNDPTGIGSGAGPTIIDGSGANSIEPNILNKFRMKEMERERLTEMGNEIMDRLSHDNEFKQIMDQIEVEITDEGMRIEIMESEDEVFFEIGTATLNKNANQILKVIGKQISTLNNEIVVEGHTDSRPFPGNGKGYSNYELSADRANSARRALIDGGVKRNQIYEIRGCADNRLRNTKDPYDVINRRISIVVKYSSEL